MKTSYPCYYKKFHCIADRCEATCCAGWQIVVDENSLARYQRVEGEFRERIRQGVDFKEGVFYQNPGKRCAFLNANNLCDMYTTLGEEAFCDTCKRYPRHIEEFENVREYTLSVSCPEAARILLSEKGKVTFETLETTEAEEEFDDFDPMLYEKLAEARDDMISVIQDRNRSIPARARFLWEFAQTFQDEMDEGTLFANEKRYEMWEFPEPDTSMEEAKALFALLHHLECLAEDWEDFLAETEQILYEVGTEAAYREKKKAFADWKAKAFPDWDIMREQLLLYFVYTYFCGAVYDEYVASKVKMSVCSVFYIEEMACAQWIKNNGTLAFPEFVRIVYRYSRELEHSDENLCLMDRIMEEI